MAKNKNTVFELVETTTEIEAPYELPEGWKWVKASDIANIYTGNSINEDVKRKKYTNISEGLNFIGTKDVDFDGTINYENGVKISDYENFKTVPASTPLLCIEGGSSGKKIGITNEQVCFGNKLCAFVCNENNPKLIYYFLQTNIFFYLFMKERHGLIGGVSVGSIKNIPIPLPPTLEEQQRIVNRIETLFAKLDQAKEKAQNVVDTFETRKASILHKAFNNQLKIDNGELKDEDWVETTIGECGNWYGGGTPNTSIEEYWKDGSILWITSKDMKSDYIEDTQLHVTQTGIDNSSAKLIQEPAVLFVMRSGILRRTFPVCMVEKEFTVNQDLKALVPFDNVNLKFLFYYCKAKEKKILNECMKSGTTVESINAQSLMNLKIKLPPINYQLSIVNFLDVILEKETKAKEAAEAVLEQIDLLKKSILARAFRGEL